MPAISATWPLGAVMVPLLVTLGAAMRARPLVPRLIAAPASMVTLPASGFVVVSRIECASEEALAAKLLELRSPMPPVRKRLLLAVGSLLNRLSEEAIKVLTLTWDDPPKIMPLPLSR